MLDRPTLCLVATVVATWLAVPTVAMANEMFACQELKAAVSDAQKGFAAHKGALAAPSNPAVKGWKTYQAKKTMTGAKTCSVVAVHLDEPKMQLRQTGYSCKFPAVFKIDKALRERLSRCVAGEVDEDSDPDEFTIWADRVSSGEGYRATEVTALVNAADGLTLWVRQSVCTNKGSGQACED